MAPLRGEFEDKLASQSIPFWFFSEKNIKAESFWGQPQTHLRRLMGE
jgi:hypothetical protein